jgi:hypothetical protein
MRPRRKWTWGLLLGLLAGGPALGAASSENFSLEEDVFSMGGGVSASENYTAVTVLGEPALAGEATSANYTAQSGYTPMAADITPPTIVCPGNVTGTVGRVVILGNPTVADNIDPSPVVANDAPTIYDPGTTTVSWSATDNSGNKASCLQSVRLTYNFEGFFSPVDNEPTWNTVKNRSTVPVKWRLLDANGTNVSSIATVMGGYPKYALINCVSGSEDAIEETVSSGGTSLSWDSSGMQFVYNWKTPSLPGKCMRLDIRFIDGETRGALFKLK